MLAICPGLQILNVCQGGTLIQHLHPPQRHQRTDTRRDQPVHIEALEHTEKRFVLAVQWHPEDQALIDPGQLEIFRSFGAALD